VAQASLDESRRRDLLSVVAALNQQWPDTTIAVMKRLGELPMTVDGGTRSAYLTYLLEDVYVTARGQRLSLGQSAATAAEHAGCWRLGVSMINESARLRFLQLNDLLRLEKQHERARQKVLERAPSDPASTLSTTIEPAVRLVADDWAVIFAGLTPDSDPSQSGAATAFLETHASYEASLSQLIPLIADQRTEINDLIARQGILLDKLATDQAQQISVHREAIRRGEEYWGNVAITLAIFGVLVGAVALWSTRVLGSSRHLPLTASPVLTSTTWAVVALLLAVGGSSAFVFRSADMSVTSGAGTFRFERRSIIFVTFLILTIVLYLATGGVLFFHADNLGLAAVFGPVLIGLGVVAAAVLLLLRRPRELREAVDEVADGVTDLDLPEFGVATGGRYSSSLQRLGNVTERGRDTSARASIRWRRLALWLGIPATILTSLGAATGFTSLTEQGPGKYVLASLALIGATLTGVATSLGATGKAESAATTAASFGALSQEIKLSRRVDLSRWKPDDKRRALEDFMNRVNVLGGVTDQASYYSRTHPMTPPAPAVDTTEAASNPTQAPTVAHAPVPVPVPEAPAPPDTDQAL
jgi:hypothetical protein